MSRHPYRRDHRRGFMFVELVFVLGMVAVAAVVSTQLYVDMTRAHSRLMQQREAQARFDGMLKAVRADVWNASTAAVDEAGELNLKLPDGKTIQWVARNSVKRTVNGEPVHTWNQSGAQLSFAVAGNTVILREEAAKIDSRSGEIAMPMVAGGLKGVTR